MKKSSNDYDGRVMTAFSSPLNYELVIMKKIK